MPLDPRNIELIDEAMAEALKKMTGAQKLKVASGMFASARKLITASVRADHPDWDEHRIRLEASRRLLHGAF